MKKKLTKIFGIGLAVMLLASLTLVSVPAGALTELQVTIDTGENEISEANAGYAIIFTVAVELEIGDTITITFPSDTTIAVGPTGTFACGPGWIDGAWDSTPAATATYVGNDTDKTVIATIATEEVGEGASVRIKLDTGITNPSTDGDYTLTVATTQETTAVTSNAYAIDPPTIISPAGVVRVFNPGGIEFQPQTGDGAINDAIDIAGADWLIVVGEGRYPTAIADTGGFDGLTIQAADGANAVIATTVAMDGTNQTIEGFVIEGIVTVGAAADSATITGCTFSDGGGVAIASGADTPDIVGCTFDVDAAATGIDADDEADITGCTFTLADTGTAINVDAAADAGTITDCTFTGASGDGVILAGDTTVTGNTFNGLDWALQIAGGTQSISGNTITGCEEAAIDAVAATDVQITANTFTGNNDAPLIAVTADAEFVQMMFNTILDNAGDADGLLIDNNDAGVDFNCTNNWWGDSDGPGTAAFSADVLSAPFLTASVGDTGVLGTAVAAGTLWDERTTVGVTLESTGGDMDIVAAARYADNPGTVAPAGTVVGYWDVCMLDTDAVPDVTALDLRIYVPSVTADMLVLVWADARGEWLDTGATANLFGGFLGLDIDADSVPTLEDMGELPFVVVTPSAAAAVAATTLVPAMGADEVSVDPTFSWGAVAGATSYDFALAEDNPLASDPFDIIDYSAQTTINAHPAQQTLKYSTTYYWRVRVTVGTETGPWTTGLFTTEAEPVEEEGGDIIVDVPDVTVESPDITVQPAEVDITVEPAQPVIPDYLLWVIIGVGAVLVIALIVLIVRTRRTA